MIKTVNGMGRYVMVQGGFPSTTYINNSSGFMNVGELRFNANTQNLEVNDGQMWRELNANHANVGLTPDAEMAIDWAIKKLKEEALIKQKAKDSPAIADLLEQRNSIDEKIRVVALLLAKDDTIGTN